MFCLCEILSSHSSVAKDGSLLGCYVASVSKVRSPRGGVEIQLYSFLNLSIRWGAGGQCHAPVN